MSRHVTVHAFTSAKGGVGKSTLAVTAARILARRGRLPVVVDADLTGSSLADGLPLCAPELTRPDKTLDLTLTAPAGWLPLKESRKRRFLRAAMGEAGRATHIPYLGDLLGEPGTWRASGSLWRLDGADDGVRYLPSSPLPADFDLAATWVSGAHLTNLGARLWAVVLRLIEEREGLPTWSWICRPGSTASPS